MGWFILIAVQIGLSLLAAILKPKPKRPKAQDLEGWFAEEGRPIPLVFGTQALSFNTVWWGDAKAVGNSSGTWTAYYANLIGTLCRGPVVQLVDVQFGGKSLALEPASKKQSVSGTSPVIDVVLPIALGGDDPLTINVKAMQMFGGVEKEGGVYGTFRIYRGTLNQAVDPLTKRSMRDQPIILGTARPGVCYVVFDTWTDSKTWPWYWGTVSTPKEVTLLVRTEPHGVLDLALNSDYTQANIGPDCNPAEVLFTLFTDVTSGQGLSIDLLNLQSFADFAAVCQAEQRGISLTVGSQDEISDIVEEIKKHAECEVFEDPVTGLITVSWARADYDIGDLRVVSPSTGARNFSMESPHWGELANEVRLTYRRWTGGEFGPVVNESLGRLTWLIRSLSDFWPTITRICKGRNITNVTLKVGTTTLTVNTDYTFDGITGVFVINRNATTIPLTGQEITVSYTSIPASMALTESVAAAFDLADQQINQLTRSVTVDYPYFTNPVWANMMAKRQLRFLGMPLGRVKWEQDRRGFDIKPLEPVRLIWPAYDLTDAPLDIVVRVAEINLGLLTDNKVLVEGIVDLWGEDVLPALPGPSQDNVGSISQCPPMALACGIGGTDVRIVFIVSDQTFTIQLWQADDANGTNASVVEEVAGTTQFYDTATTGKYYQARLIRTGWEPGDFTPWITCEPSGGSPEDPTYVEPVVVELPTIDLTTLIGTLELSITDPQNRVLTVEFQDLPYSLGAGERAEDTAAPWVSTVQMSIAGTSYITYWVTYLDQNGDLAIKTNSVPFKVPDTTTPDPTPAAVHKDTTTLIAAGQGSMFEGLPAELTSLELRHHRPVDTRPFTHARLTIAVEEDFFLPAGSELIVYYNPDKTKAFDLTDPGWKPLDGQTGPRISVAAEGGFSTVYTPLDVGAIGIDIILDARVRGGNGVDRLALGHLAVEWFAGAIAPPIVGPPVADPGDPTTTLPFAPLAWYLGYKLGTTPITNEFVLEEWAGYADTYDEVHAYTGVSPNPKPPDTTLPSDHIHHDWGLVAATYNTTAHVSIQVIADGTAPNSTGKVLRFKKYSGSQSFGGNYCWAVLTGLIPGNTYTVKWRAKLNFDDGTATSEVFCGGTTGPYVDTTSGPDYNTYGPEHSFSFVAHETSRQIGGVFSYWYSGPTNPKSIDIAYIQVDGTFSAETFIAWTDISGNALDMPAGDPNPVVGYLGDMQALDLTGGAKCNVPRRLIDLLSTDGGEAFFVLKVAAEPGPNEIWKLGGSGSTSAYPDGSGHILDDIGSDTQYDEGDPTPALTSKCLYMVRFTPAEWKAWLNGELLHAETSNTLAFPTGPTVGGDIIAYELVFTPPLTEVQRDAMQDRLNCRWALGFPYKTIDPCGTTESGGGTTGGDGGGDGGTGGGGGTIDPPPPDTTPVASGDRSFIIFPGGPKDFPTWAPWDAMMQSVHSSDVSRAAAADSASQKMFLGSANKQACMDANGNFSILLFQAWLDSFGDTFWANLRPYVASKVIGGWNLFDDFRNHGSMENSWGNTQITDAQIDDGCRRAKLKLPGILTFVGSMQTTNYIKIATKYLDGGYCQYSYNRGDIHTWVQANVSLYKSKGWRLVMGLNIHHGGSTIPGVRQPMTPAQILAAGSVIAAEPYLDHFEEWRYDVAEYTAAQIDANTKVRAIFKAAR